MTFAPSRAYRLTVQRIVRLSEHFVRFTFAGPESQHLVLRGPDQRVKLLIPFEDGTETDFGLFAEPRPLVTEWYQRWRDLPDAERNPLRTYTLRTVRPATGEVDIEFVLHGTEGPASAWADRARVGDEITLIGPDRRADGPHRGGAEWHPGDAGSLLIAGDETAGPAICGIVESLPEEARGVAFIEVPGVDDRIPVANRSGVDVVWLPREGRPYGEVLREAVIGWGQDRSGKSGEPVEDLAPETLLWEVTDRPAGDDYAWLAGEATVITGLRRHLVRELGISRTDVAFMGYWKAGRAEGA
ncbi:siderophore-interacting protein [Microbacterium sp. 1.5R]|uniref:siderophore-interacting protein n=1 Tax=Microbacterium sp. 1.5R TaxID=1916917 RepID=UPI0011A8733D|nr:siderophore-interacting protein [Microbacterium sp. 1.5R]